MSIAKMRMLRQMSDNRIKDAIKDECICRKSEVLLLRIKWKRTDCDDLSMYNASQ